jgi:hypothetical protein
VLLLNKNRYCHQTRFLADQSTAHPHDETMEEHKLQALHDTLSKLTGRKGLGTSRQYSWQKNSPKGSPETQPSSSNPLHVHFHREGEHPQGQPQHGDGDGRRIKRTFDDVESSSSSASGEEKRRKRWEKKQKKEAKKAKKKAEEKAAKLEAKRQLKLEEKRQAKRAAKASKPSEMVTKKGFKDSAVAGMCPSPTKPTDTGTIGINSVDKDTESRKKAKKAKKRDNPDEKQTTGESSAPKRQQSSASTKQEKKKRKKASR